MDLATASALIIAKDGYALLAVRTGETDRVADGITCQVGVEQRLSGIGIDCLKRRGFGCVENHIPGRALGR